jgi:hypothetical protein
MNGPFCRRILGCLLAIDTLENMGVWDVVDREDWMCVIPTTWAFRIKPLPSGEIKKLKAPLCIRGDKEIENDHYWETYAPVVSLLAGYGAP